MHVLPERMRGRWKRSRGWKGFCVSSERAGWCGEFKNNRVNVMALFFA